MEQLGDEDVLDPNPDIHALFCHYNSLYFDDSLGTCSVTWSSSRMTRCAGLCRYQPRGGCEIRLSEPLLKFRSTADLKNTLLHEMIHAFLWIENKNRDHSDHGPNFQKLMNDINCSSIDDHQRPVGGYNVTVYHDFHAEVENYQVHKWMCEDCGDVIRRAMNRAPSVNDCIEKVKHGGPCGNPCCHWHQHKKFCLGSYNKIAEPPGYEGKGSKGRNKHKNGPKEASHASRNKAARTHTAGDSKDKSDVKKPRTITNFFPVVDTGNLDADNSSSNEDSQNHLRDDSLKAIVIKLPDDMLPGQIARDVRSHASGKKCKFTSAPKKYYEQGKRYSVTSGWWDWYAEEDEGYKDVEPLINKRTERRKKQKIFTTSKRKVRENETMTDTSLTKGVDLEIIESIDPATAPSQDLIDDRGVHWCKVPGFCRDTDSLHDLSADEVLHLNDSTVFFDGEVKYMEIKGIDDVYRKGAMLAIYVPPRKEDSMS